MTDSRGLSLSRFLQEKFYLVSTNHYLEGSLILCFSSGSLQIQGNWLWVYLERWKSNSKYLSVHCSSVLYLLTEIFSLKIKFKCIPAEFKACAYYFYVFRRKKSFKNYEKSFLFYPKIFFRSSDIQFFVPLLSSVFPQPAISEYIGETD